MKNDNVKCKSCEKDFLVDKDDLAFYEKIHVPPPTLCPECRYQRRLANRNEWNFYKRNCSLCGKSMVTIYNPAYPGPVYCQPCYWSDNWDTLDYGRDFDFLRPFFEQFKEHRFTVPRIALANSKSINSKYTNQASENKDCYLIIAASWNEYCFYGNWLQHDPECVDCWNIEKCELMYESLNCLKCYRCVYLEDGAGCNDCHFSNDLRGCSHCFGCVGLRNKTYCWFNEQITKGEYQKRLSVFDWSREAIDQTRAKLCELRLKIPTKYYHGNHNINCTGDYVSFNKNTHDAFNCSKNENLKYGQDAWEARDCMDLTETLDNDLEYELEGAGWSHGSMFSCKLWTGTNILYSELTFGSENLFGCVSMIKKKYCIFNKQYSPEEYKALKEKIIAHMKTTGEYGEFFPVNISPFPYNDTVANDYFTMSKAEVLSKGFRWYDKPKTEYKIGGDILQCVNEKCAGVGAFRLHPTEIEFYKKMHLPTPDLCFPCRLKARLARRNSRKLWKRECMKCSKAIETSYSPDRQEIIYCEECYNRGAS